MPRRRFWPSWRVSRRRTPSDCWPVKSPLIDGADRNWGCARGFKHGHCRGGMPGMRTRFSRTLGAVVLAVVLALACGVAAAAAAQDQVPVIVGAVQSPSSGSYAGSLDATIAVATQDTAQGWYAYAPSYRNNDLAAISLADPTNPTIVGEAGPPLGQAELDGSSTINIFNGIAYVVSKNINASTTNNDNGTGNALSLFNVSTNPAVPQYLGSIADSSDGGTAGSSLFGAYGVTVTTINGRSYALVAAQGCLSG